MSIADRIEAVLSTSAVPFYDVPPDFGRNDPPQSYIIYEYGSGKGYSYGDGKAELIQYLVTLNVFTPKPDFALYERLRSAMEAAGFGYDSEQRVFDDAFYPVGTHYCLDFSGVQER
ncbi:MAG: hypothetical protein E7478_03845 [Ruminococcaceae bacterium]|nr:hypothetical protein [Oscillospiraceae bacterium]